jgi:hypothetical protein
MKPKTEAQVEAAKADEEKRSSEQTADRAKSNALYAQGKQPEHHLAPAAFVPTNVDGWMGNEAMNVIKEHWTDPGNPGSGIDAHIRSQKEQQQKEQDRGTQGREGRRQGAD